MTKEEYQDFALRYKGCGACFPMYHTLSRFEKIWFTAIQKDVAELEKENAELKDLLQRKEMLLTSAKITAHNEGADKIALLKENAELKEKLKPENCLKLLAKEGYIKFTSDNLTKAKVALRKVVDYLGQFCSDYPDCVIEAEQFLNSEVEE